MSHIPTIDVSACCALASSPNDCWLIRCDHVGHVVTIDVLPDDVLLTIFDFYVYQKTSYAVDILRFPYKDNEDTKIGWWHSLAHVCRRWRCLVFGSPRRLDLQLCCTARTPARETRDVWPALPLIIQGDVSETSVDNVIAQLELSSRICEIELNWHTSSQIEKLWTAMQVPFPELKVLYLSLRTLSYVPVLPDSFFGGSAPHLRRLSLVTLPLPELPKLL